MSEQRLQDIKDAGMRSRSAMAWLRDHKLPADPICYTVAYEYLFTDNKALKEQVKGIDFDSLDCLQQVEQVYKNHIVASEYGDLSMSAERVQAYVQEALSLLLKNNSDNEVVAGSIKVVQSALAKELNQTASQSSAQKIKARLLSRGEGDKLIPPCYLEVMASASRDPLTELLDPQGLEETLKSAFSQPDNFPLSVIKFDLDQFKLFHNTNGNFMVNAVLKHLAKLFTSNLQEIDIISRYAIDEFVVVLPRTEAGSAVASADQLRKKVEGFSLKKKGALTPVKVTISAGVAEFSGIGSFDLTLEKAQKALLRSKDLGRNCVNRET